MPMLEEVLYSGYIGQGPKVEQFEKAFAQKIGNENVLSLNSGTSALHLAYRLIGIEGGEVITSPMTCTATNMPILANGGKIVWGDIEPHTGVLDPRDVERKITKDTRAIVYTSWGGTTAQLREIYRLRDKYGIPVVVDAAHALGADIGPADYVTYSFQAIKHITTVDGGVLVVRDTEGYKRGKLLRWYGIDREGDRKDFRCEEDIKEWGYKFHMNDVTATIGLAQLYDLEDVVAAHRANAAFYDANIKWEQNHFRPLNGNDTDSWWLYTLLLPEYAREDMMNHLRFCGVQTSRVHERNDNHTVFLPFAKTLPGVDEFASRMLCIPVHSGLTESQRALIVQSVNNYWLRYSVGT